jgi:hypothetical protein
MCRNFSGTYYKEKGWGENVWGEKGVHDEGNRIQGYMCASADPRRSGLDEGGENLILTVKELRMTL